MLRMAVRNLWSRPVRSLLALLGLTVAIVGMVSIFSVASGLDRMVAQTFGRLTGLVALQPGAPIPLLSKLPSDWAMEIGRLPGVHVVQREIWTRAHLIDGKPTISPPRFLFGMELEETLRMRHSIYREDLVRGRFLTLEDRGTKNVVVSLPIAEQYRKTVGDTLHVDGYDLTIVGIYHSHSLLLDVSILMDLDTVRGMARFDEGWVSSMYIEPDKTLSEDALIAEIKDHFRGRPLPTWQPSSMTGLLGTPQRPLLTALESLERLLTGGTHAEINDRHDATSSPTTRNESDSGEETEAVIEIRSASDWGEQIKQFSADLDIFLFLMTSIGVTIAILSILNTMLMSVSERIVEFGVLKANGWSSGHILRLVCWESAVLGFGGGVNGCLFGWIVTQLVNWWWDTKVYLYASPGLLAFSLFFSVLVGILGGLYPAIWGARLTPMEAIRRG